MFEAAVSGARTDEIEGVDVVVRPALTAAAVDVLEADGYLLGVRTMHGLAWSAAAPPSTRWPMSGWCRTRLLVRGPGARAPLPSPGRGRPVTTVARRTNGTSGNEAN